MKDKDGKPYSAKNPTSWAKSWKVCCHWLHEKCDKQDGHDGGMQHKPRQVCAFWSKHKKCKFGTGCPWAHHKNVDTTERAKRSASGKHVMPLGKPPKDAKCRVCNERWDHANHKKGWCVPASGGKP